MKDIIIIGAGGHGKVIADIIEKQKRYKILGFLDGNKSASDSFYGYKVLGDLTYLDNVTDVHGGIVAIGDNWTRSVVVNKILKMKTEFKFIKAIHPSAEIGRGVTIGEGSAVLSNAVINSDSVIGKHVIINTKSSVGHDTNLGDYATIAPGATMGGELIVGDYTTISLGVNVIHGLEIGTHTVIGAGSTVLSNIDSYSIAYGTPAKVVRMRKEADGYL